MNNTEDPFLEDMNWINRTCKKSKKSMSEEINEDNYVLSEIELKTLGDILQRAYIETTDTYIEYAAKKAFALMFQKINKLNDLAKEKQNGRG